MIELQRKPKWATEKENVKENDLVIIKEEAMPPAHWGKGRIIRLYSGKDGLVRSVLVRTATGEYERQITKLCVLPVDEHLARYLMLNEDKISVISLVLVLLS